MHITSDTMGVFERLLLGTAYDFNP